MRAENMPETGEIHEFTSNGNILWYSYVNMINYGVPLELVHPWAMVDQLQLYQKCDSRVLL